MNREAPHKRNALAETSAVGNPAEQITDLKRREGSFRTLFDSHPMPMWVWDHETFRYLAVNDAAVAYYGYSRAQFLAMSASALRPAEDGAGSRQAAARSGGSRRPNRRCAISRP